MDDMTAFDRQIAGEVLLGAGPSEPVDDLAVFDAVIAANRQQGWGFTMFSALKFVAAAAIVALFGGFLLAGVVTTPQDSEVPPAAVTESPSPMTTEELLSGMVTEEVEAGVLRVLNDGVRDLDMMPTDLELPVSQHDIIAGEGAAWLWVGDEAIRLGAEGRVPFEFADSGYPWNFDREVVATDGTLWVAREQLWSYDGESWSNRLKQAPRGLYAGTDGAVWATWLSKDGPRLARFDAKGRSVIDMPKATIRGEDINELAVTDDGSVWVTAHEPDGLHRYDGERWQKVGLPNDGGSTHVGQDGTMWRTNPSPGGPVVDFHPAVDAMYRFDGMEWQRLDGLDEDLLAVLSGLDHREVTPVGRLWVWSWIPDDLEGAGVDLFDGSTRTSYLPGKHVLRADMAPDGTLWVLTRSGRPDEGPVDVYVITPEAVAGTE